MADITGSALTAPLKRRSLSPAVLVGAILGLVAIAAGLLVATLYAPPGRDQGVVLGFVTGTVGPTVVAFVALVRSDHAAQEGKANAARIEATADQVDTAVKLVNGHLARHDALADKVLTIGGIVAKAAGVDVPTDVLAPIPPAGPDTPSTVPTDPAGDPPDVTRTPPDQT